MRKGHNFDRIAALQGVKRLPPQLITGPLLPLFYLAQEYWLQDNDFDGQVRKLDGRSRETTLTNQARVDANS